MNFIKSLVGIYCLLICSVDLTAFAATDQAVVDHAVGETPSSDDSALIYFPEGVFKIYTNAPLDYSSKHSLSQGVNRGGMSNYKRLILITHGSYKNAQDYFKTMVIASQIVGQGSQTLVIAPSFKTAQDSRVHGELEFTDEGWLRGNLSKNSKTGHTVSSFTIIDRLIEYALKQYPSLQEVVVTGHSAGGQLTQKYALSTPIVDLYKNVHFKFVVANPGSYTYLNELRPYQNVYSTKPMFLLPIQKDCPEYDDYKFGLVNLNEYVSQKTKSELIEQYLNREVVYLVGEQDTHTDDIDQTCEAALQGKNRLQRTMNFFESIRQGFGQHPTHSLKVVPNIDHTQAGMYRSEVGLQVLFSNH